MTGAEALEQIRAHGPHVALLDVRMPRLSGIEVARESLRTNPATGILLYTGYEATQKIPTLTQREREVLRLLADGLKNEDIGRRLFISAETVRTHVRKAMSKLEADTRTQAVATALREQLIS